MVTPKPQLRRKIFIWLGALALVITVVVVLAIAVPIWIHSAPAKTVTDRLTEVSVIFTFGTLLLALFAGLLALLGYAVSTGQPDLEPQIKFYGQGFNELKYYTEADLWRKTAYIWVNNKGSYTAKNPIVVIRLGWSDPKWTDPETEAGRLVTLPKPWVSWLPVNDGWEDIEFLSTGDRVLAKQWNGGSAHPIHGKSRRRLPDLSFDGLQWNHEVKDAEIHIELFAEGYRNDMPIQVKFIKGKPPEEKPTKLSGQ